MELAPGTVVAGYEILELLGRGGQSTVYKALDNQLQRVVAIKFLAGQSVADEQSSKRFLLEARALSTLNHPHIATVFHIGQHEQVPFIVMEFIEGQNLSAFIMTQRPSVEEKVRLMIQIATAVGYAHRQGIIHRDLKPGNILVQADRSVKLVDFGLAKLTKTASRERLSPGSDITASGAILGTVSYLSPEQAQGADVDERSDLFCLGIIFFEMLEGQRPFDRDNPVATVMAILSAPPRPGLRGPGLSGYLATVIAKLLEKDPARRYQSADDLLTHLRALSSDSDTQRLDSLNIGRRKNGVRPFPWNPGPWIRRHRFLTAGLAAGLVLASLLWFYLGRRSGTIPPDKGRIVLFVMPIKAGLDEKSRYLADLITAELISTLSRSADLRILYIGPEQEGAPALREKILKKQPVRYVIDGQLLLAGESLKVSVKIVDHLDSSILWSDTIRGGVAEIYTIPVRIATAVAFVAGVYVAADRLEFPGREAFDLYTKGDLLLRSYDPNRLAEAIACLQRCIAVAPGFLPAYERIVFGCQQYRNLGMDYDPAFQDLSYRYIRQGLQQNPRSAALAGELAWYYMHAYDIRQAQSHGTEAIRLNPSQPRNQRLFAWIEFCQGRTGEALAILNQARNANELDTIIILNQVVLNSMLGNRENADRAWQDVREMYASELVRTVCQGFWLAGRGQVDESANILRAVYAKSGTDLLGMLCAQMEFARGNYPACSADLKTWLKRNPYAMESYWLLCLSQAAAGEWDARRQTAREGGRYARLLHQRYPNPTLEMMTLYFDVIAGDRPVSPDAIRKVNTSGLDSFTRYLQGAALAWSGDRSGLSRLAAPYHPSYWLNRFYTKEVELLAAKR